MNIEVSGNNSPGEHHVVFALKQRCRRRNEGMALVLVAIFFLSVSLADVAYAAKEWPGVGLRGVTAKLVAKTAANTQDPGAYLSEESILKLKQWGVILLRVELEVDESIVSLPVNPHLLRTREDELLPYQKHLKGLERVLALAEKHQFYVLLIATRIQGRESGILYAEGGANGYHQHLTSLWRQIAERFGHHPRLIGYDLLGEPHGPNELGFWHGRVLPEVVKAVRKVDGCRRGWQQNCVDQKQLASHWTKNK